MAFSNEEKWVRDGKAQALKESYARVIENCSLNEHAFYAN